MASKLYLMKYPWIVWPLLRFALTGSPRAATCGVFLMEAQALSTIGFAAAENGATPGKKPAKSSARGTKAHACANLACHWLIVLEFEPPTLGTGPGIPPVVLQPVRMPKHKRTPVPLTIDKLRIVS